MNGKLIMIVVLLALLGGSLLAEGMPERVTYEGTVVEIRQVNRGWLRSVLSLVFIEDPSYGCVGINCEALSYRVRVGNRIRVRVKRWGHGDAPAQLLKLEFIK